MVYCDFVKAENNVITYKIGGKVDDITGLLQYNLDDNSFDVVEYPKESKVYDVHIMRMLIKAKDKFLNGEYPPKLAYEI